MRESSPLAAETLFGAILDSWLSGDRRTVQTQLFKLGVFLAATRVADPYVAAVRKSVFNQGMVENLFHSLAERLIDVVAVGLFEVAFRQWQNIELFQHAMRLWAIYGRVRGQRSPPRCYAATCGRRGRSGWPNRQAMPSVSGGKNPIVLLR